MTDKEKLIAKMNRKAQSLANITKRYRTPCKSTFGHIRAYEQASEEMEAAGLWGDWCKQRRLPVKHTAGDYFNA